MPLVKDQLISVVTTPVAGTSQGTASVVSVPSPALIVAGVSGGDGTAGFMLPPATKGKVFYVKNVYSGNIKVFPAGSNTINGNSSLTMAANTSATFVAQTSGATAAWYTIPLLPS